MDATTVERLLGVPPGYAPWRVADMASRGRILATWLSSAVSRGIPISEGGQAYLARMRRRMAQLHTCGEELAAQHGLSLIKGVRIAQFMPPDLLRQSGDIDLVAPDEESLWRAAMDIVARFGAQVQSVSLLDAPDGHPGDRHVGIALKWPAEEPELDKPMGADITTCAFSGDMKGVPVRARPLPEDDLCGLFAVAEERFQRKYRIKDLLDLLVLARALEQRLGSRLADTVCEHAVSLALAPELRQLVGKAAEWVELSRRWLEILSTLGPLAEREKALRRPARPGLYRLRFGFPLDTNRAGELAVSVHHRSGGDVALTPIGTCLLLDDPVLAPDDRDAAATYAQSLGPVPH